MHWTVVVACMGAVSAVRLMAACRLSWVVQLPSGPSRGQGEKVGALNKMAQPDGVSCRERRNMMATNVDVYVGAAWWCWHGCPTSLSHGWLIINAVWPKRADGRQSIPAVVCRRVASERVCTDVRMVGVTIF